MSVEKLSFYVDVVVEERENYFAATTKPFAITVYGNSEEEAEEKALKAVGLLLEGYSKPLKKLGDYLSRMGVKHAIAEGGALRRHRPIVRECRREMRLEAAVG